MIKDGHGMNYSNQDVWYCTLLNDASWSPAVHLGKSFTHSYANGVVFNVSLDNITYFIRDAWDDGGFLGSGVSLVGKTEKGFSTPEQLVINIFCS